ncbi:hypothetical protein F6R98_13235 [Candidatus Methylospira mobilis]|uniref:Nuclear transport factor 2 family protein n=1 Tax=Candidatus Methylospira mobilis TaxID=1808979 RepID=A0A5Q0BMI8_9GAMM|nr:hypothetical protein [Candidatus Methylospira mobilis]QFY43461.1 hypothetical protein F6R98_13235 [Candidatus Methylospira mobilis]WNV03996.1 hypothetical protein RP726_16420 [Candidatus Methylospira mobilis]
MKTIKTKTGMVIGAMLAALLFGNQPALAANKHKAEAAAGLTQQQVTQFLQQLDDQAMQKNVNGVMAHFDATAQVVVLAPTPQGPQPMNFGFEDYRRLMEATLSSAGEYKVRRQDVAVHVSGADKAVVTDINFETLVTQAKTIKTIANEQMEIVRVDGKLKLTRLNSQVLSTTE